MCKFFKKNISISDIILCPVCEGTGRELWKHYVDGKYVEEKVTCKACEGSGKIGLDEEYQECMYDSFLNLKF